MGTRVGTGTGTAETGTDAATDAVTTARAELGGADPELAVVFASSVYDYESIVETVRTETDNATLLGSSSAGEFTERGPAFESVTVCLVASDAMRFHVGMGEGLSTDIERAVADATESLPSPNDDYPHRLGINLHDGLVGRGDEIAMLAYQSLPVRYVGGSAADDLNLEETVVFADDRVASDAVAIGLIESERPFAQAVGHGHEPIAGGFEVTAADGSVVQELDGRPAFAVWQEAVREPVASVYDTAVGDVTPDDDLFEELLTRFEFGIETGDGTYKIRWPGLTPDRDGPLHFATRIPEGTELFLMDSNREAQVSAAESVSRAGLGDAADSVTPAGALAFDCVCQAAILGDEFDRAVERMADTLDVPLAGMQTYGEVSMRPDDMRAYHNTTSSLVVFPE